MTESLTERLRQRVTSQTAETEKIINAELGKLTNGIRRQLNADLASIQNDITATSLRISGDLSALRWASRYWWIALILTWLIVGGLLTWHSMSGSGGSPGQMSLSDYQTFTHEGRKFLIVPVGSEPASCIQSGQTVGCVLLPKGE